MSDSKTRSDQIELLSRGLDDDEKRIIRECEAESLMYRCIPLGLMSMFAVRYAMSKNMISSTGRWFKLGGALFSGYIIGKVSYAPVCREKILKLIPDSNLARAIRDASNDPKVAPHQSNSKPKQNYDSNEPVVFFPDPVEVDTHTVPIGVNQYGDPIYGTKP